MNTLLLEHFDQLISTPEDVERLNDFILELAIRGKLVEQDSKDEPVSNLLAKIQEVKRREFRFSKITKEDDKPFDLPQGWAWIRFGDLTINRDGERIPLSKEVRETRKGKYDYYGASGVIDHIDGYLFDKPLLLIGEDGANLINRSTPIAFIAEGKYWVNNHAHVIDAVDFGVLKYLEVFINAIDLRPYITGTAQPKMNQAKMNSIVVALPPLAEQGRIVARVEELFAQTRLLAEQLLHSRTELDRLNESALAHLLASETSEEFNERWCFIAEHFDLMTSAPEHIAPLRQSILELAVRGKLTRREIGDEPVKKLLERINKETTLPPIKENEKPFELPEGWEWARWGDISPRVTVGYVGPMANEYVENGIPFLRSQNVRANRYEPKGLTYISPQFHEKIAKSTLKPGDLVVVRSGSVGVTCVIPETLKEANCSDLVIIQKSPVVLSDYGSFYMNTLARRVVAAGTVGMALTHFNTKSVAMIPISIPPLAEQERIVKRVEQLLGWCDTLEAQLKSAEEERGRLVESVLAGVGL